MPATKDPNQISFKDMMDLLKIVIEKEKMDKEQASLDSADAGIARSKKSLDSLSAAKGRQNNQDSIPLPTDASLLSRGRMGIIDENQVSPSGKYGQAPQAQALYKQARESDSLETVGQRSKDIINSTNLLPDDIASNPITQQAKSFLSAGDYERGADLLSRSTSSVPSLAEGKTEAAAKKTQDSTSFENDKELAEMGHGFRLSEISAQNKNKTEGNVNKTKKEELMNLDKSLNDLLTLHNKLLTGPIGGTLQKTNLWSEKRAAFETTRNFVLKTMASHFEGAKMSDMDMKFYDKMVPSVTDTEEQARARVVSLKTAVNNRILMFKENRKKGMKIDDAFAATPQNPNSKQVPLSVVPQENKPKPTSDDELLDNLLSGN